MALAISFYGLSTFEGSMMAIKTINAMSHYTDWTVGHVHSGALGWVAMISIGTIYYLIPVVFHRPQMYSIQWIHIHFWLATGGTMIYVTSMWINGFLQGLMWRASNDDGSLTYTFVDALVVSYPGYLLRFLGGVMVVGGMCLMAYNCWKTVKQPAALDELNAKTKTALEGASA